jgi:hypothetical protein
MRWAAHAPPCSPWTPWAPRKSDAEKWGSMDANGRFGVVGRLRGGLCKHHWQHTTIDWQRLSDGLPYLAYFARFAWCEVWSPTSK